MSDKYALEHLLLSETDLNISRGKALAGDFPTEEMLKVFDHIDALEDILDSLDYDDYFGTEGWRRYFGLGD